MASIAAYAIALYSASVLDNAKVYYCNLKLVAITISFTLSTIETFSNQSWCTVKWTPAPEFRYPSFLLNCRHQKYNTECIEAWYIRQYKKTQKSWGSR